MTKPLPTWFQADQIFEHGNKWFFGSAFGLHVGPYPTRKTAEQRSQSASSRLVNAASEGELLRLVRELLHDEWRQIEQSFGESATLIGEDEIKVSTPPISARRGEAEMTWFRSDRFFQIDDVWFFSTREGIDVGPYASLEQAKMHERRLTQRLISARTEDQAYRTVYEYKHTEAEFPDSSQVTVSGVKAFRRLH